MAIFQPTTGSRSSGHKGECSPIPSAYILRGDYRATLTRAASKFPLNVVLPFGVVAPSAGSAEEPAGIVRAPAPAANVPLAAANFAEAGSNEYGGGFVVLADIATEPAITPTPEPSSKPMPPQVNASSNFLPLEVK